MTSETSPKLKFRSLITIGRSGTVAACLVLGFSAVAVADAGVGWPTWGGDYGNTRYSPLDEINTKNVSELEVNAVGPDPFVAFYLSPLVIGDVMYIPDIGNFGGPTQGVIALNARTGEEKWHTTIQLGKVRDFSFLLGWRTNRGLGYGRNKIYMATIDARVWALDAETGEIVTEFKDIPGGHGAEGGFVTIGDPDAGYYLTAPPIFIPKKLVPAGGPASGHNLIIIGTAGAEDQLRGSISAYDAQNGATILRVRGIRSSGWPNIAGCHPGPQRGANLYSTAYLDRRRLRTLVRTCAGPQARKRPAG